MRIRIVVAGLFIALFMWGCEEEIPEQTSNSQSERVKGTDDWTIPVNEVYDGGPGKDGIPAISEPKFISVEEVDFLREEDLVLGFRDGDEVRAYPHAILNWHEIVNDQVGDAYLSVTYCPLTGTGIGWDRVIEGEITTFGVSGLLYNTNLIPYDRLTDSYWSQVLGESVHGELVGNTIEMHQLIEVSWKTWKEMYPDSKVMSTETGYQRSYTVYPYGAYLLRDDMLLFPVANSDDRLPNKQRVHGVVISGSVRVYPFSMFGESVIARQETYRGKEIVVAGSEKDNFIVSYFTDPGDGTVLHFKGVQDKYPVVMTDQECNLWDVFGRAVEGPRAGTQLEPTMGFMGYWLTFPAFYPGATIAGPSKFDN
jgi:hypothetical protein